MSICLAMIVKDEAHVIVRCLASHHGVVDKYLIVDTGSTDGTQDLIRAHAKTYGLDLELVERPWVDFGHNRTEAVTLARAKADYVLMNDADHVFHGKIPANLTADCYSIDYHYGVTIYPVDCLLASTIPWRYEGVLHEYVTAAAPHKKERLQGPWIKVFHEGARSRDHETYKKDVAILEAAVAKEPNNPRYMFYLAQSYRDAGQRELAVTYYRTREQMGGWVEEVWYSKYQIAVLYERLLRPPAEVQNAYLDAYNNRPTRAEPLVYLAQWHRSRGEIALAYIYAAQASTITKTDDKLFVDQSVYDWKALDELSVAAWYMGNKVVGRRAIDELLKRDLPVSERRRFEDNVKWYTEKQLTAA